MVLDLALKKLISNDFLYNRMIKKCMASFFKKKQRKNSKRLKGPLVARWWSFALRASSLGWNLKSDEALRFLRFCYIFKRSQNSAVSARNYLFKSGFSHQSLVMTAWISWEISNSWKPKKWQTIELRSIKPQALAKNANGLECLRRYCIVNSNTLFDFLKHTVLGASRVVYLQKLNFLVTLKLIDDGAFVLHTGLWAAIS